MYQQQHGTMVSGVNSTPNKVGVLTVGVLKLGCWFCLSAEINTGWGQDGWGVENYGISAD